MPVLAQAGRPVVQELVTLLSVWNGDSIDTNISNAASKYIDYSGMAECVVGSEDWLKLAARQKREFTEIFRRLIEQRYYPRWHKIFKKAKLVYHAEVNVSGDTLVKTSVEVGKKIDSVVWRLHQVNGGLKVTNLTVGDKDLMRRLKERFNKHMNRDGFEGMMAWLKNKLDDKDIGERTSMVR